MTERPDSPQLDVLRRRLKFRSWHRGTREADLLLGHLSPTDIWMASPPTSWRAMIAFSATATPICTTG